MQDNPFVPPQAPLHEPNADTRGFLRPATRSSRLLAFMIDQFVLLTMSLGVLFYLDLWGFLLTIDPKNITLPSSLIYNPYTLKFALFFLINGYLLLTQGQTLGKLIMNIRIVDVNGKIPPLWKLLFVRYALFFYLPLGLFPYFGSLFFRLNALTIFLPGARCLHDRVAGTFVAQSE